MSLQLRTSKENCPYSPYQMSYQERTRALLALERNEHFESNVLCVSIALLAFLGTLSLTPGLAFAEEVEMQNNLAAQETAQSEGRSQSEIPSLASQDPSSLSDKEAQDISGQEVINEVSTNKGKEDTSARPQGDSQEELVQARKNVEQAQKAHAKAEEDLKSAISELANSQNNLNAAKSVVAGAETALGVQRDKLIQAQAKAKNMMGFIDWMLKKPTLTKGEQEDLKSAKEFLDVLTKTTIAEGIPTTDVEIIKRKGLDPQRKIIVLGEKNDPSSMDNIEDSLKFLKQIEGLIQNDDNFVGDYKPNAPRVNFDIMIAAMRGIVLGTAKSHHASLMHSHGESLAWGYGSYSNGPHEGWYVMEKHIFDEAKQKLDIKHVDYNNRYTIAAAATKETGHYTHYFLRKNPVMGMAQMINGWTCHSLESLSLGDVPASYSIDEFRSLFDAYKKDDSVNVDSDADMQALQKSFSNAQKAFEDAQNLHANNIALVNKKREDIKRTSDLLNKAKLKLDEILAKISPDKPTPQPGGENLGGTTPQPGGENPSTNPQLGGDSQIKPEHQLRINPTVTNREISTSKPTVEKLNAFQFELSDFEQERQNLGRKPASSKMIGSWVEAKASVGTALVAPVFKASTPVSKARLDSAIKLAEEHVLKNSDTTDVEASGNKQEAKASQSNVKESNSAGVVNKPSTFHENQNPLMLVGAAAGVLGIGALGFAYKTRFVKRMRKK